MARKSRTAVLKRQREVKKAEKQAMKREKRALRESDTTGEPRIATTDEMAGYGFSADDEEVEEQEA